MAKKIKFKKEQLLSAYKELDEVVDGIEPPIECEKLKLEELEEELHDAYVELSLNADEDDEFTKPTQKTFDALIEKYGKEVLHPDEEDEEDEDAEDDEEDEIDDEEEELTDLEDLGDEIEDDEEDDEEEDDEDEATLTVKKSEKVKKGKKSSETVKAGKAKKERSPVNPYTRVDALMEALNEKPKTMDEWVKAAEKTFKKNNGKNKSSEFSKENLTVEFLVKLAEKYKMGIVPLV